MSAPAQRGPRLREHGLRSAASRPGRRTRSRTSRGVRSGTSPCGATSRSRPTGRGVARTGVTAIVPAAPESLRREPVVAGAAVLNGAGELTSFVQIGEWGLIETPIYLTSTHAVGRIYDGAVAAAVAADPTVGVEDVVIPVVAECDDSWLSEARVVQVEAADAGRAVAAAEGGRVAEGAVGAGTGMTALGWKAGIGTASRLLPELDLHRRRARPRELRLGPRPANGRRARRSAPRARREARTRAGRQLHRRRRRRRAARDARPRARRPACRARPGADRLGRASRQRGDLRRILRSRNGSAKRSEAASLDELFEAVVDATEEAVLNALWAAPEVTGREGRVAASLPHDAVLELLAAHGRLDA